MSPRQYSGEDPKDFGTPADAPRSRDQFRSQLSGAGSKRKMTPQEAWERGRGLQAPRWPFRPKNKGSKVGKGKRGKRGKG